MKFRFGVFEFDDGSSELRKSGRLVPLEPQPARALTLLLARADQVVSRDDLREAVWGKETHVDFDRGLAYCISQIRISLGDSGDSPRFVQTLPRKGYRFIAPVHEPAPETAPINGPVSMPPPPPELRPQSKTRLLAAIAAMVVLIAGIALGWALRAAPAPPDRVTIAVSIFDNETGIADHDRLVAGLSDVVVERLTNLAPDRVAVIGNAAALRQPRNIRNLKAMSEAVRADYALLGQLQKNDSGLRFITHFIRLSDEAHLKANRLIFPTGDLSTLEQRVVEEFQRAVDEHILTPARN